MRIDSIELCNFRIYYGKHRLRLYSREDGSGKPALSVIIGRNGTGKSVILDSVIFALFGADRRTGWSEPEPDTIMNRHARELDEKECYVQLGIRMDEQSFFLKRSMYPSGNTRLSIKGKRSEGRVNEILASLRSRITPDSAKYLFFSFRSDPAEALRLTGNDAINSFLGLNVLSNASDNLDRYHEKLMEHVDRNTRARELSSLRAKLKRYSDRQELLKREMEKCGQRVRESRVELKKYTREACKIKGLGRVLNLHRRIQKKIFKLKEELAATEDRKGIYEMTPYFLIKNQIIDAMNSLKERVERRDGIRYKMGKIDAQMELVETLFEPGIRTGKCGLCENRVDNTAEALTEVFKLKDELRSEMEVLEKTFDLIEVPPDMDMERLAEAAMVLERYMGDLKRAVEERQKRLREIGKLRRATGNLLMRFPTLADIDHASVPRRNLQQYVNRIADKRREVHDEQLRMARLKQEYRGVREQYDQDHSAFGRITVSVKSSMKRYLSKMDLARRARLAISDTMKDIQKENRETIEAGLNRILAGLFSKKGLIERVVLRKNDYSLAVRLSGEGRGRGEIAELEEFSDGEKVLIFISLIWALNRMQGGTTIVYDSPFSFLDEENKRSIARNLARLPGHQVMLTTRDDLSGIRDAVLGRAQRIYEIVYCEESRSSKIIPMKARLTTRAKRVKNPKRVPGSPGREVGVP